MKRFALAAMGLLLAAQVAAEQKFGVEVYPGAKAEPKVAKQLEQMGIKNGATYRTQDAVAKVADYYRRQGLKELPGTSKEGAGFESKGVMVTIQNPWMDMDSGATLKDTLISIVRK